MATAESTTAELRAGNGPPTDPTATHHPAPSPAPSEAPTLVVARPVPAADLDTVAEHPIGRVRTAHGLLPPNTDQLAIASAVCGFTAIIPVISQIAGVTLGIAGLIRIRRARGRGEPRRGAGWACAGLISSGIALAGWIVVLIGFLWVRSTVSDVTGQLGAIRPGG